MLTCTHSMFGETDAEPMMMTNIRVSEARIRSAYKTLSTIKATAGAVPRGAIEAYNAMRTRYVALAEPVAEEMAIESQRQNAPVGGKMDIPPEFKIEGGLFGLFGDATSDLVPSAVIKEVVPEMKDLPPALAALVAAQAATPATPAPGFGSPSVGTIIIIGLIFLIAVAIAIVAYGRIAQSQVDAATIEGITETRKQAFDAMATMYANCAASATTVSDKQICASQAAKSAKLISDSGTIEYSPKAKKGFVYYLGLFGIIAAAGAGAYFVIRARKSKKLAPATW